MSSAVGSLWDKNSWYWEERACTFWARGRLIALLLNWNPSCRYAQLLVDAPRVKGEASVSSRKGKIIAAYDFTLDASVSLHVTATGATVTGKIGVADFSVDSVSNNDYDVRLTLDGESDANNEITDWFKLAGAIDLRGHLKVFDNELRDKQANEVKLKATDKVLSEQVELMNQAVEQKPLGSSESAIRNNESSTQQITGSVWNVNSWQWEERPMTHWMIKDISKRLQNLTVDPFPVFATAADVTFFHGAA
eukprot:TRINITY_DN132008_c0_g1_i1.p1 TRINITY_DN132008_c0_g1~~TRINITY_DN132008_c0_g1_i1.p1  ORF type:complete len:250 (-),score=21.56 TRINITY_DN132008_c0_g1_i1:465-1214(-)